MWWDEAARQWKRHPMCRCGHTPCYCSNLPALGAHGKPVSAFGVFGEAYGIRGPIAEPVSRCCLCGAPDANGCDCDPVVLVGRESRASSRLG